MYPLNMKNAKTGGFAVANDEKEHKALSEAGFDPKWEDPKKAKKEEKKDGE